MAESQKAGLAGWEGMGTSGNSRSQGSSGETCNFQVSSWPQVVMETLWTFPGRKEEKMYYKKRKKAFDAQFIGRHNAIYERFNQHYQEPETASEVLQKSDTELFRTHPENL